MSRTVSREFAVTAACCIWPPSERRDQAIRRAIGEAIDWNRVSRIVKRQRVAGLVHDGLSRAGVSVPPDLARQIKNAAGEIARKNLLFAAESVRIQRLFDEAGVALLFLKGVTLAQRAYAALALKHSWDIDLLVMPDDVPKALTLLAQAGYHPYPPLPPATDEKYQRWIEFAREYVLFHTDNAVNVEIHWKPVDNSYHLPGISAQSPSQTVMVANGASLRTLPDDDLFTYLCIHGATHGWSRLKWLADVAALVSGDSASDAERRLEAARKANAVDCVAQTYLLSRRLFGTPSLSGLAQELHRSYRYRWLEDVALATMTKGNAEDELESVPIRAYLSHFLLGRGWRFAANELWNKLNMPYDLLFSRFSNLPWFLYPFVRVVSWIGRRGRTRPLPAPPRTTAK